MLDCFVCYMCYIAMLKLWSANKLTSTQLIAVLISITACDFTFFNFPFKICFYTTMTAVAQYQMVSVSCVSNVQSCINENIARIANAVQYQVNRNWHEFRVSIVRILIILKVKLQTDWIPNILQLCVVLFLLVCEALWPSSWACGCLDRVPAWLREAIQYQISCFL